MAYTDNLNKINELIAALDNEVSRLGWSSYQASEFLRRHYGKRSRWLLTDEEMGEALELFRRQAS